MNLSKVTKACENLHPALRLYLLYLCVSLPIWLVNKFILGITVSEPIAAFSEQFGPTVTAEISSGNFFLQSLAVIFVIYLLIIILQALLKMNIGDAVYILLAILVALAAGTTFGGGLITYTWEPNILTSLLGQLEWLGGALIISAVQLDQKNDYKSIGVGSALIIFETLCLTLI